MSGDPRWYWREKVGTFGIGLGWERLFSGGKAFYLRLGRYHHEWTWRR